MSHNWIVVGAVLLSACAGRAVPRPTTAAGYRPTDPRDIGALGLVDMNVDVVAAIGPLRSEDACDLVMLPLLTPASNAPFGEPTGVVMTLPRARYLEVRDLHMFDHVRVRGYVSNLFAEGCGFTDGANHRYLWADTIERAL